MAEIYNEMLIRNVDCGVLYFQIKDDEVIKEYEELKKEKAVIENSDNPDRERFVEIQKRIEELSKEIFSMKKEVKFPDKNNRFYYSGTIADSLMGRKMRQLVKEKTDDKAIRTIGDSDYTDLIINLKFKSDIMIEDDTPKKAYDPETKSIVEADGKKMKKLISKKKLRKMAYKDGVTINGVHYVNYQRTSSKARVGNCLFIDERYYDVMNEWQNLGIPFSELKEADIVSIRSYQSLIASSIIGELEIPVDSILLIDDISGQATMDCNVVKPFPTENGRGTELKVVREPYTQKTDLWDGQSLLDFSVFKNGKYAVKDKDGNKTEHSYEPYGFMLLRNHFFKTAAFNTNLQEYYKERFKGVENPVLKDMFGNEFKTEDVKMVTTPNSVKIFKFADIVCEYMIDEDKKKHLRELQAPLIEKHEELRKAKQAVATAKRKLTMLLNYDPEKGKEPPTQDDIETSQYSISEAEKKYDEICMSYDDETKQILKDIKLEQQRLTWDWFRKKIKDEKFGVCKTEHKSKLGDKQQLWYQILLSLNFDRDDLWELAKLQVEEINLMKKYVAWFKRGIDMRATDKAKDSMMLALLNVNNDISKTKWFVDYKRFKINGIIDKLLNGKIQIKGSDFCVLFGNPFEMLRASCGDTIETSILNGFECYCQRYENGEELYGMRSPHICTANNALLKNTYRDEWKWLNLSDNIIIVNFFDRGAFLAPKWNGCDVDSDTAFIGNNSIILEKIKAVQDYMIPINCVPQRSKFYEFTNENLSRIDNILCSDMIGKICNLARDLSSFYFHLCNTGTKENKQKYLPMIYDDICLLEVLSNISIDSAKRTYDTNIETEIKKIRSRPYLKTENAIIEGDTIVFTETRYKKSLSEKKIKEYERLVEKRNNATTEKELEEINAEINDVLMVSKDYMIHPYFTKNLLKSQPKKKKRKKYENEEQKELHHQKQKAYVQEQKALREVIYRKMESPMDILSQIIREKIVRSPRTIYLPCFVDVLKPIPSGMKADYNRINAIKELCLEANSKINCVRGKYREGSLSYDEMYEEINTIEKDVINNIKEREITPFDINVLIRKVYDKRPKRDPHHGKIIRDEKGKYIYVDKRDQDIIKAKAGGLLLRYVYAAHKDDFLKAIKESGKGTVSYVQKYEPKKHTVNKVSSLKDVGKLMEQDNEIFSLDGVEYEIVKRKAE